jgi:hypothetical protein
MTTVTLKMPEALSRKLASTAKNMRTSQSEILRVALTRYIETGLPEPEMASAFDLVREFSGSVQGATDLSTNPGHLKGYGE